MAKKKKGSKKSKAKGGATKAPVKKKGKKPVRKVRCRDCDAMNLPDRRICKECGCRL